MDDSLTHVFSKLDLDGKGNVRPTISNAVIILENDPELVGSIRTNMLSVNVECSFQSQDSHGYHPLCNADCSKIYRKFEEDYSFFKKSSIREAMNIVIDKNRYNPIVDALKNLQWDGTPRIKNCLHHFLGVEINSANEEAFRSLLFAAIDRVYNPGAKFDYILCIVGGQGIGKSSFCKILAMRNEWFTDDLTNIHRDDVRSIISGHWVIELPEMVGIVGTQKADAVKGFITREKDTYRIPYERHAMDFPRTCVFIGTTNRIDFIPFDRTGNRRFIPIVTNKDEIEEFIPKNEISSRAYMQQVWAEAHELYLQGAGRTYLSDESEEYFNELRKNYAPEDTNLGRVKYWLDTCGKNRVCTLMIADKVFGVPDDGRASEGKFLRELGDMMNHMPGWERPNSNTFNFGIPYGHQRYWIRSSK